MTENQIFQLLGFTFFAIGVGMLLDPEFVKKMLAELERSLLGTFLGGLISLVIGYFLVIFRESDANGWSLVLTLIGWIALIKGLIFLMFPQATVNLYKKIIVDKSYTKFMGWFSLVLGTALLYLGFFA